MITDYEVDKSQDFHSDMACWGLEIAGALDLPICIKPKTWDPGTVTSLKVGRFKSEKGQCFILSLKARKKIVSD